MKPTGATKEARGHSPLPWKAYPANDNTDRWYVAQDGGDTPAYGTSITGWGRVQQSKADAQLIVTAVNERERLREALGLAAQRIDFLTNWIENTYGGSNRDVELGRQYAAATRAALNGEQG